MKNDVIKYKKTIFLKTSDLLLFLDKIGFAPNIVEL